MPGYVKKKARRNGETNNSMLHRAALLAKLKYI